MTQKSLYTIFAFAWTLASFAKRIAAASALKSKPENASKLIKNCSTRQTLVSPGRFSLARVSLREGEIVPYPTVENVVQERVKMSGKLRFSRV
jgi:hypothetical protein